MKLMYLILSCSGIICLISCGTSVSNPPLYTWKDYQKASYQYYKEQSPKATLHLTKTYEEIIRKPAGSRKVVPPGTYAEYGYLLLKDGQKAECIKFFKMEIELYPESAIFMNRLIKKLEQ